MRIAIVGGGISGLATAFYLQRARPDWTIDVYEKKARLGGTMHSVEQDGFLFEAGGNGFLTNKPDSLELARSAEAGELLQTSNDAARIRYIFTDRLYRLPESPPAFLRSGLLTLPQKLRVAAEVLIPPNRELADETVQHFGERRLGKGFTDCFLNAMVAGIYAATPAGTSIHAAFPKVVELEREFGGLFRGMIKKRKSSAGPGGVLTSFAGGVSGFIQQLQTQLEAGISVNSGVESIARVQGRYELLTADGQVEADHLVLSTPAYAAADIVQEMDADLADRLRQIEYAPIAVVGFGYDGIDHPLNGFGLLTTEGARLPILGVLWDSSVFPGRAPDGKQAVRVMIGGQRNPELALQSDQELVATAIQGIAQTMGCQAAPVTSFVKRWEQGIPSYPLGHLERMDRLFAALSRYPGLYLNNNAYYGISMNDCVANAKKTVAQLVRQAN